MVHGILVSTTILLFLCFSWGLVWSGGLGTEGLVADGMTEIGTGVTTATTGRGGNGAFGGRFWLHLGASRGPKGVRGGVKRGEGSSRGRWGAWRGQTIQWKRVRGVELGG